MCVSAFGRWVSRNGRSFSAYRQTLTKERDFRYHAVRSRVDMKTSA